MQATAALKLKLDIPGPRLRTLQAIADPPPLQGTPWFQDHLLSHYVIAHRTGYHLNHRNAASVMHLRGLPGGTFHATVYASDLEAIMNPEDSPQQPGFPQMVVPIALPYSGVSMPRPPGTRLITATGVIGIIVAVFGYLTAMYRAVTAFSGMIMSRAMPAAAQTQGAVMVLVCGAIVGAVLASMLLAGSIGLLRMRTWSRRLLNWWAFLYLASVVLFLLLEVQVVVPSETNMMANMMTSMPQFTPPTNAAGGVTVTSTTAASTATTNPANTITFTANAVARPMPMMVPAQMAAMMKITYDVMAYVKAFICLIFPIAVLIVMQLRSVRGVLAPVGFPQDGADSSEMLVR